MAFSSAVESGILMPGMSYNTSSGRQLQQPNFILCFGKRVDIIGCTRLSKKLLFFPKIDLPTKPNTETHISGCA